MNAAVLVLKIQKFRIRAEKNEILTLSVLLLSHYYSQYSIAAIETPLTLFVDIWFPNQTLKFQSECVL